MNVEGNGGLIPARRAKRLASPDDEDDVDDTFVTQRYDKHARKISWEHPPERPTIESKPNFPMFLPIFVF